jgi:formylglycine-generating enzyme required for sulfatase activity
MGVWEWTSSWFEPYPGFRPYPYAGYSTPWFNGTHRVLRGASWATAQRLCRPTFRNWYEPGFREIPAGFRCAGDL